MLFSSILCAFGYEGAKFCDPSRNENFRGYLRKPVVLDGGRIRGRSDDWGTSAAVGGRSTVHAEDRHSTLVLRARSSILDGHWFSFPNASGWTLSYPMEILSPSFPLLDHLSPPP